ncbi:MAG: hypothetical protein IIC63_01060 [Proteobacteria bacterium]|nr:hypothetical protein [Pseudomonadota bacterium]
MNHRLLRMGISFFCLSLFLTAIPAIAAEKPAVGSARINYTHGNDTAGLMRVAEGFTTAQASTFQLIRDSQSAGLDFDLGGSETRKLQLLLDQPVTLGAGSHARVLDSGANLIGLDATLDIPLGNHFSLTADADQQLGKAQFQSLGSIHCINGILRPDSYTASGCQFINESYASSNSRRISLGARYDTGYASASINWFTRNADLSSPDVRQFNMASGISVAPDNLLVPGLGNLLLAPSAYLDPLQQFKGQTTGVDLDFRVGIATDSKGDIRLGLAFSRVLDADYQGIYANSQNLLSWTLAEPFNSARMNLEWSGGNFSSGIRGFYREPVNFLNRNSVDSLTTFDVHFTWKTPWNGSLSVGASNILNAGAEETSKVDIQPSDPLESIYGRIPYVRYQQDL